MRNPCTLMQCAQGVNHGCMAPASSTNPRCSELTQLCLGPVLAMKIDLDMDEARREHHRLLNSSSFRLPS